jgi:hypothetical protein
VPDVKFHNLIEGSPLPDAKRVPSGEKSNVKMEPLCSPKHEKLLFVRSHNLTEEVPLTVFSPKARNFPSGEKVTPRNLLSNFFIDLSIDPEFTSQR